MTKRFLLLAVFFLTSCRQELSPDMALPEVTSVFPTNTPALTTPVPATPTIFVFSPVEALASGPIHLIAIGDDMTRGEGDEMKSGYPSRLLPLVDQLRPGSSVANFGATGWTSADVIDGTEDFSSQLASALDEIQSVTSQGRAAVVLVWVGGNDLWELYSGTVDITVEQEEQDARRFSQNLESILFNLRNAQAEVIVAKLDDQSQRPARTRSETYPDITESEMIRMGLQVQRYNTVITALAEQYGALTVDFYGSPIFIESATLASDGYHPNAYGYDLIAQAWYKSLIKILP